MPDEQASEVLRWLEHAAGDLRMALAIARDADLPARGACFHAQQCAEKSLKAALILTGVEPPKLHNLNALLDLIPESWRVQAYADLEDLTFWAVDSRYPSDDDEASGEDAQHAIETARQVHEAILYDIRHIWTDTD